ncbi:non-hydrolyzing UDP-N-acetylglucosamine 2-epimerase [Novilysobacter defluvii]|uniref:non-hydrolyzing UDP-N-acetylglucosamine 2-epimerase n=1 Tax=Novilysobacter defluvii TaxID=391738 RepID=UPI0003F6E8C3|nr:UDP-N-acetylglucosamine 2-epimerase (non-hydrolyzing) [Lysobacter defluvii]
MSSKKVMVVFGTRPEAIKMAPVATALRNRADINVQIVVTAQHRELLDQVLHVFGVTPTEDLDLMEPDQSLPGLFSRILLAVTGSIKRLKPDMVLVHGDTTTTLAVALAAFYLRVPIGHVEAGLRTGNLAAPWPEEANRRLTAPLAQLHFAPTAQARRNLLSENVAADTIHVTGNTVVDALLNAIDRVEQDATLRKAVESQLPAIRPDKKLVLVTGHRRENIGERLEDVCRALLEISSHPDVEVIYPVHPNPAVGTTVKRVLEGKPKIHLIPPLDYLPFIWLMRRADVILTDSGGIQEEAPALNKPVLVLRDTTERPEAIQSGTAKLVGTDREKIVEWTHALLFNEQQRRTFVSAINPFGDGKAAERIASLIEHWLNSNPSASLK